MTIDVTDPAFLTAVFTQADRLVRDPNTDDRLRTSLLRLEVGARGVIEMISVTSLYPEQERRENPPKSEFRVGLNILRPWEKVLEVWWKGEIIATIAGREGPGVRILSKHALSPSLEIDDKILSADGEPICVLELTINIPQPTKDCSHA